MGKSLGLSLHIGVDYLDKSSFPLKSEDGKLEKEYPDGWEGRLKSCEKDANALCAVAESQGFRATKLLSPDATSDNVQAEFHKAAKALEAGDLFFVTYAGHGGQLPDNSGDEGRRDSYDETWCLHDRHLLDDEIAVLYSKFKPGVRILVLSDSCHSGTVTRNDEDPDEWVDVRGMPPGFRDPCYWARETFYDDIQAATEQIRPEDIKANLQLISACQDNEKAGDGKDHGAFTGTVLAVWNDGQFTGNYREFYETVRAALAPKPEDEADRGSAGSTKTKKRRTQEPNHHLDGINDERFLDERPFSIS
jgi:hypothetical protein